jgi:hypothetical protein
MKAPVNEAPGEYIMKRNQKNIFSAFVEVNFEESYDFKTDRKVK